MNFKMGALCNMVVLIVSVLCLFGVNARKSYQQFIPNGNNVPDPCTPDPIDVWSRVGHDGKSSKERNQFGTDFSAFLTLNATELDSLWQGPNGLCLKDSDQDGRTNGIELGDPKCEWMYTPTGTVTPQIVDIEKLSNPGRLPMELVDPEASPEHALQCVRWCLENSETAALREHLDLHASKLSALTEQYIQLMLDSVANNLTSSFVTFLPYVDDVILNKEAFTGGKTVIDKMLCQAVANRETDIVCSLLERGADSNISFRGKPLLHIAACNGDFRLLDSLVQHGADINAVDKRGDSVLCAVITSQLEKKVAMVTHLIKLGVKIKQTSASGKSPLHIAASHSGDVVETLIAEGQNVDITDDVNKDTPLHIACGLSSQETIMRLIQHGAKFNSLNKYGETPLAKLLKFTTDFHDFHSRTRINIARKLISIGFRMSFPDQTGSKPSRGRDKTRDKYLTLMQSVESVPSLQNQSRAIIINSLQPNTSPVKVVNNLEIPQHLKKYLLFRDNMLKL